MYVVIVNEPAQGSALTGVGAAAVCHKQPQPVQSAYPEPYQPEPYQPEEPYYPRQETTEYTDPEWRKEEYWPQEQYQYEQPVQSAYPEPYQPEPYQPEEPYYPRQETTEYTDPEWRKEEYWPQEQYQYEQPVQSAYPEPYQPEPYQPEEPYYPRQETTEYTDPEWRKEEYWPQEQYQYEQPVQSAYPEPYQPEPYQPEEPYYPRQETTEYTDPEWRKEEYWPQEQYQYEQPVQSAYPEPYQPEPYQPEEPYYPRQETTEYTDPEWRKEEYWPQEQYQYEQPVQSAYPEPYQPEPYQPEEPYYPRQETTEYTDPEWRKEEYWPQEQYQYEQYNNQQNMYPNYTGASSQQWPQQPQQQQQQPQQQYYPPYQQEYPNANLGNQQPYNQNYPQANNQPGYQFYPNQPQPKPTDAWEDNWDWGWDESAKQAQLAAQNAPPQSFNNANVLEESFASTDTWNWQDKKEGQKPLERKPEPPKPPEDVKLSDKETVKERLPNLALGKRFNSDLTPQWSIESQMSQESSEGLLHYESTYRSENQSRNSTKSSPGHNDTTSFNFQGQEEALPPIDWPTPTAEEKMHMERKNDELTSLMQEISIANEEPLHDRNGPEAPTPSSSPASIPPPPVSANLPPMPPTGFPSGQNPFKNTGTFSHKITPSMSSTPSQPFPGMSTLTSPAAVNKVQHSSPVGYGANLETAPDNSERPDQPQVAFRPLQVTPQVPDNLEVAPQNDRNEYLQTAHLSTGDYENTDFSRGLPPPPGLRRMVVGQQESSVDEPPPGLARMVPGQQTEADNSYSQPSDNYMDRHIDGQPTDENPRPYRQADGQQTPDYSQPQRTAERRPIGLDRMVPGEPSNDEYSQYQAGYANDRVVTGVDHDYPIPGNAGPTDIREQNVDGSDYTEPPRNPLIYVHDVSTDYNGPPEEQQREVMMEGENLLDISAIIAPADMTYILEQTPADVTFTLPRKHFDGADTNATDPGTDRKTDLSENDHPVSSSRRPSINRTSGEDSERDRLKGSPRRDRAKHKSSRDKDRDDGRYSRDRGKYDREERRSGRRERDDKDRRERRDGREREASPEGRKHRRGTRSRRYETEDTDYYSDRERDRRRYREGSYASKPPRPDDYRRYDDRQRYNATERDRRYDDDEPRRYGRYRDIDPTRKYGSLRRDNDDSRRVVTFSDDVKDKYHGREEGDPYSLSRTESRDAGPTDDEVNDTHASTDSRRRSERDRERDRHRRRHRPEVYYDGYGSVYSDPYALQRQQYQYYEHLRLTNPTRYMEIYKQIMAGQPPPPPPPEYLAAASKITAFQGYGPLGFDNRGEDRGSVHSGRSSANGLKGTDTYYGYRHDASLRDAPSLRTDLSDKDLNTDASLNLHLEESTVRSERMTPFKFSTAHIKGNISSRHVVVVRPSYPVDGLPATVQIVSLSAALANDPAVRGLVAYPGPLVKGVTHKKSVIEYCTSRVRSASGRSDVIGYVLLWELLALLLRQNGVVVGTDIAELLMKNKRDFENNNNAKTAAQNADGRGSSLSEEEPSASHASDQAPAEEPSLPRQAGIDEKTALDQLREYLTYGNRQEAIEWAMSHNLWGHAFQLCAHADRRTRAAVAARFVADVPRTDPLHTLYNTLAGRQPPVATCVSDERWGDWRAHAAIILSNTSAKPENETRTLTQLGDTLSARGLLYSAQFCYVSARVPFSRHPLAPFAPPPSVPTSPPRLALLLADSRADSLNQLATNEAIFATEIYEYALSLSQEYCIGELQAYKFLLACRLVDAGEYERALAYTEILARAVTRSPRDYPPQLVTQLALLADRLKYHDPTQNEDPPLVEEGEQSSEPSPRHQLWLDDVTLVAQELSAEAEASKQATPAHQPPVEMYASTQYAWEQPQTQPPELYNTQPAQSAYPEPYQPEPYQPEEPYYPRQETTAYTDPEWRKEEYWPQEQYQYEAPADAGAGAVAGAMDEPDEPRPTITMPGAAASRPALYADYEDDRPGSADTDRETDNPKQTKKPDPKKQDTQKKSGWLGGILTKLTLRPPNQMILPDDKNPTIVWDAVNKRWQNLDSDGDEPTSAPLPPPKTADISHLHASVLQAPPVAGLPPTAPVSNIFKMQKGRHIKKSYVDVFNPSGAPTRPLPPAAEVLGPALGAPPHQYMLPQQSYDAPQPDEAYNSGY